MCAILYHCECVKWNVLCQLNFNPSITIVGGLLASESMIIMEIITEIHILSFSTIPVSLLDEGSWLPRSRVVIGAGFTNEAVVGGCGLGGNDEAIVVLFLK